MIVPQYGSSCMGKNNDPKISRKYEIYVNETYPVVIVVLIAPTKFLFPRNSNSNRK